MCLLLRASPLACVVFGLALASCTASHVTSPADAALDDVALDDAGMTDANIVDASAADDVGLDAPVPGCTGPLLRCDGECTDIRTDDHHCGACGVACDPGEQMRGCRVRAADHVHRAAGRVRPRLRRPSCS
jgi:hypothetical protein